MGSSDLRRLLLLASVWGGSFVFIRVAVPQLGPIYTVEARVTIAGLALLLYARATKTPLEIRSRWRQYLLLGGLNSALPFLLISSAEVHISASMAAILNATTPLFGAIIAAAWLKDRLTGRRVLGILTAFTGVIVLVGLDPLTFDRATILSIAASLTAASCYGLAGAYTRVNVHGARPMGMAAGSQLGAAVLVAPLLPFFPPHSAPSATTIGCVLALALAATAFAYILYFRLIVDLGPARALTVTFLTPAFGVAWGAVFLHEPITPGKLIGCAIILAGTGLVTVVPAKVAARL